MSDATVTISLTVGDATAALDFYTRAFGAEELFRLPMPDGSVAHAEFTIGNTRLFISGEAPEMHAAAMPEGSLSAGSFSIMVDDCDAAFAKAVEAGAKPMTEPKDEFWGTRGGQVADPFGFRWHLSHEIEKLSPEEIQERARKLMGG